MKIYAFEYNPCYYESAFGIEGLYFSKKDAYKAMRKKKLADYDEWVRSWKVWRTPGDKFPEWRIYRIKEYIVQ